jgi:transposase-like protein
MVGHGAKLGRKKEQAIAALLSQRGIEEAARAAGIGPTTLRRWMRLPDFQAEYLQARRDVVLQTNARMQQNSGAAAAVLLKLMVDPTTPPSVRARTAQCVLECANKSLELEDLEVRLGRLEELEQNKK